MIPSEELSHNQEGGSALRRGMPVSSFDPDNGEGHRSSAASATVITVEDDLPPADIQGRAMNPIRQLPEKNRRQKRDSGQKEDGRRGMG